MRTLFKLNPQMQPGDMVATFEGCNSRADALHYLRTCTLHRVRVNRDAFTVRTIHLDDRTSMTVVRVGRF
jgi:hypothetical protein